MPKKSKPRRLTSAKLVRERARALVGPVPPTAVVPDKRRRAPKHKGRTAESEPAEA